MRFFLTNEQYQTYNANNAFGQYDPAMAPYYPLTGGMHIGTDWKIPSDTPIHAPADGEIIAATVSTPKGNVAVFLFTDPEGRAYGVEFCHLRRLPKCGRYKEGDVIAQSDNTGTATTAPHLHSVMHLNARVTANYNEISSANRNSSGSLQDKQLAARNKVLEMVANGKLVDSHKYFHAYINH